MASGEHTRELYLTIKRNVTSMVDVLTTGTQVDPSLFAQKLCEADLVSSYVVQKASARDALPAIRVQEVIQAVMSAVKLDSSKYHDFVKVLRDVHAPLADSLNKHFGPTSGDAEVNITFDFAALYCKIVPLLAKAVKVDDLKRYLRTLRHDSSNQQYIPSRLYQHLTSVEEILDVLEEELYFHRSHINLFTRIVNVHGCPECKRLLREYESMQPSCKRPFTCSNLSDEKVDHNRTTKKIKVEVEEKSIEAIQEALEKATGVIRDMIIPVNRETACIFYTFLVPETMVEAFTSIRENEEKLSGLAAAGILLIEVVGIVMDVRAYRVRHKPDDISDQLEAAHLTSPDGEEVSEPTVHYTCTLEHRLLKKKYKRPHGGSVHETRIKASCNEIEQATGTQIIVDLPPARGGPVTFTITGPRGMIRGAVEYLQGEFIPRAKLDGSPLQLQHSDRPPPRSDRQAGAMEDPPTTRLPLSPLLGPTEESHPKPRGSDPHQSSFRITGSREAIKRTDEYLVGEFVPREKFDGPAVQLQHNDPPPPPRSDKQAAADDDPPTTRLPPSPPPSPPEKGRPKPPGSDPRQPRRRAHTLGVSGSRQAYQPISEEVQLHLSHNEPDRDFLSTDDNLRRINEVQQQRRPDEPATPLLLTVANLRTHDILTGTCELRQFACGPCQHIWWRAVLKTKPVSRCWGGRGNYRQPACGKQQYDALPRHMEYGIGRFVCQMCGHVFYSKCQATSGCMCFGVNGTREQPTCGALVTKPYIHPQFNRLFQSERRTDHRHWCDDCQGMGRCPNYSQIINASLPHDSTLSTFLT